MRHVRNAALAASLALSPSLTFAAGTASAQTAAPAATAPKTDLDTKSGTLSDKLSDTNGVIRPTGDVDPAMHKGAPQSGSMPVIRPGEVAPGTAK